MPDSLGPAAPPQTSHRREEVASSISILPVEERDLEAFDGFFDAA
jgi:hypothetical protein